MIKQGTTRKTATLIAVLLGLGMGSAHAQSESDVAEVSAANNAFYAALSALDAAAMEKVWAHEPYVTSIGPANKAVTTGWVALQDGYKSFMACTAPTIAQVMNKPVDTQVHINGNVAWVVGRGTYERTMKDGTSNAGENFMTNVFEKKEGRWLMVSHHAQRVPQ
jgi:ketosteroid isomerase-like protein